MTDAEELTPERRDLLSLSARIIALENANLILCIVLGVLARATHSVDLGPIISAALDRYEDAAERHDFAVGLNDAEPRFLADQIKQRLSVALKLLPRPRREPDLSWLCRIGQLYRHRGRMA